MSVKKILFLTGTRADYGKLQALMHLVDTAPAFELNIFATGMHMQRRFGMTINEVKKSGFRNIYTYINQSHGDTMDIVLAKTVTGLSDYCKELQPDLLIVHGDRVEALAGAIVGAMNNILVSHIEGGEVSGTVDELIRHSVSKLAHQHLVCNQTAYNRLLQLGENPDHIHIIGSPDMDIMLSDKLPSIENSKNHYDIDFDKYAILLHHPVTTETDSLEKHINAVADAVLKSKKNYLIILPNNDHGSEIIINTYKQKLEGHSNIKIFPSVRFEHFLTLLKNCSFIIGNSSAGIREAPVYGIPTINIGSRQTNRAMSESVVNVSEDTKEILDGINTLVDQKFSVSVDFGEGNSAEKFLKVISNDSFWKTSTQKLFIDL
jgi:UDP-N-acetylglucosamine 2-epimerase (hydrolysing)